MAVDTSDFAPYAPTANVRVMLAQLRERGWSNPLTFEDLIRSGVPEGNAPRTLAALKFLGLVDEEGRLTEAGNRIRRATDEEYPLLLGEQINTAYSQVFKYTAPASATHSQLENAFRGYQPQKQRGRMIVLFRGLCGLAGIMAGEKSPRMVTAKAISVNGHAKVKSPEMRNGNHSANPSAPSRQVEYDLAPRDPPPEKLDHQLLHSMLAKLPSDGRWTKKRREQWLNAFVALLDFHVVVPTDDGEE